MCLILKEYKFSIVAKIFSRILSKYPTVLGDFELLRTVREVLVQAFLSRKVKFFLLILMAKKDNSIVLTQMRFEWGPLNHLQGSMSDFHYFDLHNFLQHHPKPLFKKPNFFNINHEREQSFHVKWGCSQFIYFLLVYHHLWN